MLPLQEMTNGTPLKVADRRLGGTVDEEEMMRALKVAFWCIQDEVFMRPSMGEVVRMLEGSIDINTPPMPQTVLELIEEGLEHVYRAMKRDFHQFSSFTINSLPSSHTHSHATCSYSTMSPRQFKFIIFFFMHIRKTTDKTCNWIIQLFTCISYFLEKSHFEPSCFASPTRNRNISEIDKETGI